MTLKNEKYHCWNYYLNGEVKEQIEQEEERINKLTNRSEKIPWDAAQRNKKIDDIKERLCKEVISRSSLPPKSSEGEDEENGESLTDFITCPEFLS